MKKLFLALPLLLAACQSERVAFQFQPVAPTAAPRAVKSAALAPAPLPRPTPGTQAPETQVAAAAPAAGALARRPQPAGLVGGPAPARPGAPAGLAALATPVAPRPWQRVLPKRLVRRHATAGPAHTAENGLGGIALFFLAVVLGLLAGLGALVALIPGVSFWGGVGLAAAGLLVLFLLYSLLSGGKKKKAKPAK